MGRPAPGWNSGSSTDPGSDVSLIVVEVIPVDADRFALLSRSLENRSRRGALRAMGALGVAGLVGRLGVTPAEARKKKGGKKKDKDKTSCPECTCPECTCPAPSTCPARDTCPHRSCCQCRESSPAAGCNLGPPTTTFEEIDALCSQICGRDHVQKGNGGGPASTVVTVGCTYADTPSDSQCVNLRCPI